MEEIGKLASGLASAPTSWMLAIALISIAYLFRQLSAERKERLDMVIQQEAAHRETLMKVLPLTAQIVDAMKVVDRLTTIAMGKKD